MLWVRKLHLYIGVLFAPAIIFFASTGLLQVYGLHEDHGGYQAPQFIMHLASLHKDQTFALHHSPGGNAKATHDGPAGASPRPNDGAKAGAHDDRQPSLGRVLLKAFSAAVSVGLIALTSLGIYMAYAFGRNRWLVNGLLAAGVLIPLVLIFGLGA
jgi:hypothetical protein